VIQDVPDRVLVEQAAQGDGDSFTELCRRYYPSLVAIGHSILGDRYLAEDAAQQALANAAVKLPKLRKPEHFGPWLAAICRHAATDIARRRVRAVPSEGSSVWVDADSTTDSGQVLSEAVDDALASLPAKTREVIYLRFYDGLTYEQISTVLGISEQAINGRLRRAKKMLAKYLRRRGFDEV
jgi:RNA polymerase sigma-70 factor (ECF subfamily)